LQRRPTGSVPASPGGSPAEASAQRFARSAPADPGANPSGAETGRYPQPPELAARKAGRSWLPLLVAGALLLASGVVVALVALQVI
jgi:hypothetical protein